jgi:hypothetical protein
VIFFVFVLFENPRFKKMAESPVTYSIENQQVSGQFPLSPSTSIPLSAAISREKMHNNLGYVFTVFSYFAICQTNITLSPEWFRIGWFRALLQIGYGLGVSFNYGDQIRATIFR